MMFKRLLNKPFLLLLILGAIFCMAPVIAQVNSTTVETTSIDRIQLVKEQINLLKNRLRQAEGELLNLKEENKDDKLNTLILEKASRKLLDKASLDVLVSKSNLDSINIELGDAQQIINWLDKKIIELDNQINIKKILGAKHDPHQLREFRRNKEELEYQRNLQLLEKERVKHLQKLQDVFTAILTQKNSKLDHLADAVKDKRFKSIQQEQVKDELAYQEQQNHWLEELNSLYIKLKTLDPSQEKNEYAGVERNIFYANENANYAYTQSLIARYKDQIQQMRSTVVDDASSIRLLNATSNQVQTLNKQIIKLEAVLTNRMDVLDKHINYLSARRKGDEQFDSYLKKLSILKSQYKVSDKALIKLTDELSSFRKVLDQAIQTELSARQGLPTLGTFTNIGKDMLLVPILSYQIVKSLSNHLWKSFHSASFATWLLFTLFQSLFWFACIFTHKVLNILLARPSEWRDQINFKWLFLLCLERSFVDIFVISNTLGIFYFFDLPIQSYLFVAYLSFVWLMCRGIMIIARICLVETTHDTSGHDVRLYRRLRSIIIVGGIITALTVFVHQLLMPIPSLTMFCDRLFLVLVMLISLLLLRSREVVPNLILWQMESQHPYLQRSIRFIGILVPLLLLANSVIGLFGYLNLVITISWYEGIFIIVLIMYLMVRGFLTDGMEHLSRMMIQYVNNGWLYTEAFLKPLDNVLRITLFLVAWAVLFLLYGWDNQSPIVVRLTGLLHYQLLNILNSNITPINIIELCVAISIFYWSAKWTREFVYRLLVTRTKDMGIRNSIAILSQYCIIILGFFICLRVLGIDLRALTFVVASFAFAIGWGLRDLANNFATGFLLLFERPIRVGDIINVGEFEGEVERIGSRAITISTWDHMELVVPNIEIFNKSFTNWTSKDNIVRCVGSVKVNRHDNPHQVKVIIQNILAMNEEVLKEPIPEVLLKEMGDHAIEFEMRYYVNIRQVRSRVSVMSAVLMSIWDAFEHHGIKPPYPQHQVQLMNDAPEASILKLDQSKG